MLLAAARQQRTRVLPVDMVAAVRAHPASGDRSRLPPALGDRGRMRTEPVMPESRQRHQPIRVVLETVRTFPHLAIRVFLTRRVWQESRQLHRKIRVFSETMRV